MWKTAIWQRMVISDLHTLNVNNDITQDMRFSVSHEVDGCKAKTKKKIASKNVNITPSGLKEADTCSMCHNGCNVPVSVRWKTENLCQY